MSNARYDPVRECFQYYVTIGETGNESFQIRINDLWHQSLYPDGEEWHSRSLQANGLFTLVL